MYDDRNRPERPRAEPEIIPPDRDGRQSPWRSDTFTQTRGTQRIYVTRLGPFGLALLILALAAFMAIVMIAVLGAVLFWIPVVAVAVIIAALLRFFRG